MMRLLLFLAAAVGLSAQYAEILGTDYPANSLTQLNRKLASRVGSGAPVGACTAGLDLYLDSAVPAVYICPAGTWVLYAPGSGTVSTVSVVTANGVSGTVANPTTTPAITIALGNITPSSVAASGNVTGANLSGTNTGDQTSVTGNAGTATALQTARNINGVAFDGTANITITASLPSNPAACPGGEYVTDIAADGTLTCAAVSGGAHTQNTDSGTTQTSFQIDSTNTGPRIKNNAGTMEIRNSADSALAPLSASSVAATTFTGALSGNASTATTLAANPADCSAGQYATTIGANGDLTCAQVAYSQISSTPSLAAIATSGSASDLGSGTVPTARLGSGTADGTTFLRGDQTWATISAGSSDWPANAQTGTTYTVLTGDKGKAVTFSNGSPVAVTLPQAGGSFPDGWYFLAKNIGGGAVTITPTTSTISGAAAITLDTGEFAFITSDGTNYEAATNRTTVDSALSITRSRTGTQIGAGASVVTLTGTQTLENKTFVAPALGTPASGVATNLTGTAAGLTAGAATALAANPANCSAGSLPRGVEASGAAEGCAAVNLASEVTGTLPVANGGRVNRQITLVATDVSSTGTKSCSVVEVAGTIVAAHLISNALPTGSNLVVDVLKVAFASYTGPASASSITASAVPTIATGDSNPRYEDTTLTGWTTSVAANDVVCVAISTAPSGGATWAALSLEVQ